MDLPLASFDTVYHIGTLDPADKGSRGSSLEGHGLSFAASRSSWKFGSVYPSLEGRL